MEYQTLYIAYSSLVISSSKYTFQKRMINLQVVMILTPPNNKNNRKMVNTLQIKCKAYFQLQLFFFGWSPSAQYFCNVHLQYSAVQMHVYIYF